MPNQLPPEVAALLHAGDGPSRDAAWERFVAVHTRLLLHVSRTMVRDPDRAMDAYAWLLERLREKDVYRLRGFAAEGRSKFTTWLVVVARRLCVDWHRHEGGRTRPAPDGPNPPPEGQLLRRRLLAMTGEPVPLEGLRDNSTPQDIRLDRAEVHDALVTALRNLPPSDQLLLSLRFEDGLKAPEIARVMRFSSQFHVYRRLDHVLGVLRVSLNGHGIDGPP